MGKKDPGRIFDNITRGTGETKTPDVMAAFETVGTVERDGSKLTITVGETARTFSSVGNTMPHNLSNLQHLATLAKTL